MHLSDDELVTGLADQVDDGPLLAAAYARVDTALGFTRVLSPLGNYLIARPAARAAANEITEETDVPLDAAVVLAVTAGALHIWSADPMLNRVGDHLGHIPLERIAGIEATPGRTWQPLRITLDAGKHIELEARGPIHAVVAAVQKQAEGRG